MCQNNLNEDTRELPLADETSESVDDWLQKVARRMQDEKKAGILVRHEVLTIRELLAKFGRSRRGYWVVSYIRHELENYHLRASPNIEFDYIDNHMVIQLDDDTEANDTETKPTSPIVRVDSLTAAHNNPVRVAPDQPIGLAITIMWIQGFSQLPVMTNERDVQGVISWRSIGKAYANKRIPEFIRDCMEEAHEIDIKTTFADATHEIWKHDYVLVRGEKKKITGILTAADLAYQFEQLAHPFLLIGEIEHYIRNLVHGRFSVDELNEVTKEKEDIGGLYDLTFGDYCQLFGREESWDRLMLKIDRKEFVKHLERVRSIRNDVMHFSPDGIGEEDVEQLNQMVRFLRELVC